MPEISQAEVDRAEPVSGCEQTSLDPRDWEEFRAQAHRMLDDILDYTKDIRQRPVWQPIPEEVRARFRGAAPAEPSPIEEVHEEFMRYILPFAVGNAHPGFMGWVHGGGTPVGMLAEMLAAGLNANVGGRDQVPVEVERQIAQWMRTIFGFPESASGLFVTGTSMANFISVVVARDAARGFEVRGTGVAAKPGKLAAYGSSAIHDCVGKALDLCGLGRDALRTIAVDTRHRMDLAALEDAIRKDRAGGVEPFLIVGTAGTVDTGAIDDLAGLAEIAQREKLWFHVDGACGALAMLAPELAAKLRGIERADSLAFDFHKWGQVPYDAGFVLLRNGELQRRAFAASAAYLRRETRGLAAGEHWPCDYGPDLSRGFRALKTWFTLKVFGTKAIGDAILRTCRLASHLARRIQEAPELELLAPVELNIVCFRYRADDADRINAKIVVDLQESGIAAPSTTTIDGKFAIRAAIVNHRTGQEDIDRLIGKILELGRMLTTKTLSGQTAAQTSVDEPPRVRWERELAGIEARLAANSSSTDLRCQKARLLADLGRLVEARDEYIRVLQREPYHLAALNNLGSVLVATGHREAARIAYREAVTRHPEDPASRVNLGNLLLDDSERFTTHGQAEESLEAKRQAREQYEQALRARPDYAPAHEGLSYLLEDLGEPEKAAWHRREAFRNRYIIPLPYRGEQRPLTVLHLVSTTGGNVRLQRFLDDRVFRTFVVCPEFYDPKTALPDHQLVVNGIGDAEVSAAALTAAQSLLGLTKAGVVNPPSAVLATDRSNNAKRLAGLPGVVTAVTVTVRREELREPGAADLLARHGLRFPLLLRAPGFHTGLHFVKVENLESLPVALTEMPGDEVIVMQYLDARGADGKSRKYRAMMIDGQIYPLHCAISNHWKIHYFTAEMAENADHRAEDAAFLSDMPRVLGPVAMRALAEIQSVLGLDYGGIDFGLNAKGEVLVFEANATMVVNPPDPGERWNYRRPAYQRIHAAVLKMLMDRAQRLALAASSRA